MATDDFLRILPNGQQFTIRRPYTADQTSGVVILALVSCLSATAVIFLLSAIAISAWNTRKSNSRTLFVRSHVSAYFISLLLCEIAQTTGSIMSIRWVQERAVSYGSYCTIQGVFKQVADVGTAGWSMILALNTFYILFLQWKLRRYVLILTLAIGWSTIAAVVVAGPTALQRVDAGPFYAISGYWCWISNAYPSERITLDYLVMFLSALLSFVMYSLVFLRLRGNVLVHGWRVSVRFGRAYAEDAAKSVDTHAVNIAKGMLLYPVAYTILLIPIAVCRFAEWTGHNVSFAATIVSDAIFLLSGFVNVLLFLTTRRVLPLHSVLSGSVGAYVNEASPKSAAFSVDISSSEQKQSIVSLEEGFPHFPNPVPPPNAVPRYPASRPEYDIKSTSENHQDDFVNVHLPKVLYHGRG